MTDDGTPLPEELLSAYVDGELGRRDVARVEARLTIDADWRAILAEVTVARDALRALPDREAPAGFWLRVVTRVAEVDDEEHGVVVPMRASRRARSTGPARWAAIVGAAAAVIVGVAVAAPERHHTVAPSLQNASDSHAATASLSSSDPLSNLAPAAVPVNFQP